MLNVGRGTWPENRMEPPIDLMLNVSNIRENDRKNHGVMMATAMTMLMGKW